jgi:hypothetical protein
MSVPSKDGGSLLPVCGRATAPSSATHLSGPVPARNADPENSCVLTHAHKEDKPR